jgi:hypothetical protein
LRWVPKARLIAASVLTERDADDRFLAGSRLDQIERAIGQSWPTTLMRVIQPKSLPTSVM